MIEKVKREDMEDVYGLICELEQEIINKDYFKETYYKNLNQSDIYYYGYWQAEKMVGFISLYVHDYLHHQGATGEIVELVIHPEYRGLRIGDCLLKHIETVAREKGLIQLELSTSVYRKKAHDFYEAHGYLKDHYNYTKDM